MPEYYTPKKIEKPPFKKKDTENKLPPNKKFKKKKKEAKPREKIEALYQMNVEIVEVYPEIPDSSSKIKALGTIHMRLPSYGLDIRGVMYMVNKDGDIIIRLPEKWRKEGKEMINYPFISFTDPYLQKALVGAMIQFGRKAVKNKLKELENNDY